MHENTTSKIMAYISAVLSGLFILLTAGVIICQKQLAELYNVPSDHIETAGTVIPFSAIPYIILSAVLTVICVRVILKKYSAADRIIAAVLWGVMFFAAFAAYRLQWDITIKYIGTESIPVLITLHYIISVLSALLVMSAIMTVSAADCSVFTFNCQPADNKLGKVAIGFFTVYIFFTLAVMFISGNSTIIIYSVIVCWVFAVTAIILLSFAMSKKGGAVPMILCLVILAATLVVRPIVDIVQSKLASFNGSEVLAEYGKVSAYCGFLDILLYAGTALAVCQTARNIYSKDQG